MLHKITVPDNHHVYVTSATELSEQQKQAIEKNYNDLVNNDAMEFHYQVDPTLLSGFKLQSATYFYDQTGLAYLNDLQNELKLVTSKTEEVDK